MARKSEYEDEEEQVKSTGKASMKDLEGLHGNLCTYFKDTLESGEETISSGTISNIVKYLKDNNVSADLVEGTQGFDMLASVASLVDAEFYVEEDVFELPAKLSSEAQKEV